MSLDAERIADLVEQRVQAHRMHTRAYLESMPTPPGLDQPTDEQFGEFVKMMVQQYPPQPLLFPVLDREGLPIIDPATGAPAVEVRVLSPWIAMLSLKRQDENGKPTREPLVDGGEEVLARIERLAAGPKEAP